MEMLTIASVARDASVNVETIRFYQRKAKIASRFTLRRASNSRQRLAMEHHRNGELERPLHATRRQRVQHNQGVHVFGLAWGRVTSLEGYCERMGALGREEAGEALTNDC